MTGRTPSFSSELTSAASRQVQALLRVYPDCRVVNPERTVFDLPFDLSSGRTTCLRVSLGPLFPQDPPVLSVLTPLVHPAVNPAGRVTARTTAWDYRYPERSSLVSVVTDCIALLQDSGVASSSSSLVRRFSNTGMLGPGSLLFPNLPTGGAGQHTAGAAASQRPNGGPRPPAPPPPGHAPGPSSVGSAVGPSGVVDLESLPVSRLEELLSDQEAFKQYAQGWLARTPAARALADIKSRNAAIAQQNLDMQSAIDEVRTHVAIVRSGDYATMKTLFDDLYKRQEDVLAKMGPMVMLGRLRAETDQADQLSEELLDSFQGGSMTLEQLVEQYSAKREAFHVIDIKRQAAEHHMFSA